MAKIRVITDSACDLSTALVKKYGITVVPLNIHICDETFVDRSMKNSVFYKKMSLSNELPKTSHPSEEKFLESYEEGNKEEIQDLIVITISSKLSHTYATASLAKLMCEENNKIGKIAVIDSEVGSVGQGQLAVIAARLIEAERSFEDIVDILENIKNKIVFYGVLDTLENTIKGGKVNSLTGKIADALDMKVILEVGNHKINPILRVKGYDNALEKIKELIHSKNIDTSKKSLFIGHANCLHKAIFMKDIMVKDNSFESVHIVEIGSTMGAYTGEGAILVSVL